MPSINQRVFGGIKPAIETSNQQPQQASIAHNVVLRDTSIRPILGSSAATVIRHFGNTAKVKDVYRPADGECCSTGALTFDRKTSVVPIVNGGACSGASQLVMFPCDCDITPYRYSLCDDAQYPLVMPQPVGAPTATLVGAGTMKDAAVGEHVEPDTRVYLYTWVDQFAVESAPSMPSAAFMAYDDQTFRITISEPPPAHAVATRIYRSVSDWNLDEGRPISMDSSFQLVAEIEPTATTYLDNLRLKDIEFGTLLTFDTCPPPCMSQVSITEEGRGVGFYKNELYFSERGEIHNWPQKLRLTLPDRIVAISVFYDTVFVLTTGRPYRLNTSTVLANDETDTAMDILPLPQRLPCVAKHSVVATSFGCMYASAEGMVALAQSGGAVIVGKERIDEYEWSAMAPNLGAWHRGRYYGVRAPKGGAFIMDIVEEAGGALDLGDLVTVDLPAVALHGADDNKLWWLDETGGVHTFETDGAPLTYTWQSKDYVQAGAMAFAALKVVGDYGPPLTVTLFCDGRVVDTIELTSSVPVRIKRHRAGLVWSFRVVGATRVKEVHLATSIVELSEF